MECLPAILEAARSTPPLLLLSFFASTFIGICVLLYTIIYFVAPIPRPPRPSEKRFSYIDSSGQVSEKNQLPCWYDNYIAEKEALRRADDQTSDPIIETPYVFVSVVIPAYNEQDRLSIMLTEAIEYLEREFPSSPTKTATKKTKPANGSAHSSSPQSHNSSLPSGYEILVVSDGSTDATVSTALSFARSSPSPQNIRIVSLAQNRGKGGAVTHGLRHVRGAYAIFADADGATRFSDLGSLITACRRAQAADTTGLKRGVAVGSRAHLVASDAVVKRSFLRNLLMHGFHLFLRLLTPPRTARIGDTQCGFKLFSREGLGEIVPYMHSEGWIFDVEMLMLAESAGIPVEEVPVGWKEVGGSKLNVVRDSVGMAWGLAVLRAGWGMGIYRRS